MRRHPARRRRRGRGRIGARRRPADRRGAAALADALAADPDAARVWAGLSVSKQRAHVLSVAGAKTDATRTRRVQKVLDELSD